MDLLAWFLSLFTTGSGLGGGKEDYERLLTDLDQQIRVLEVKLMEGRLAERSLSLRLIGTGVIALYYLKRFFGWVYGRKILGLEEELQALRGKQRIKLEELKQKSDYYRTIKLIERFDHQKIKTTPKKETPSTTQHPSIQAATATSVVQPPSVEVVKNSSVPVLPRSWLDRWTDYLLGEEDSAIRYALICSKCHAHNGLSLVPVIPFSCRNCHYLNNNNNCVNEEGGVTTKRSLLLKNVAMQDVDATPIAEHPQLRKKSK